MPVSAIVFLILLVAIIGSWYLLPAPWARLLIRRWRGRLGLTSHTVTVGGVRWHYLKGGDGPVLLLLHGFGADTGCWLPLASKLRQRFSLVIPDLPGFGDSEPPHNLGFDIETQALRLVGFLDELGIKRCLVAGNSMGGYLATGLADLDPERVTGLWLLAPLGVQAVSPGDSLEAIDEGTDQAGKVDSVNHYRREFLPTVFHRMPWIPYPLLADQARRAMARQDLVPRMLEQARFESEPLEEIANRVSHPVLVHWGEHDHIVNPAGLPVLAQSFENVTTALTRNCGHLPMFECPEESRGLFLDFLEKHNLLNAT